MKFKKPPAIVDSDVLALIFGFLGIEIRINSKEHLHRIVKQLQRYHSILVRFSFKEFSVGAFSNSLDDAFCVLSLCKIIQWDGHYHAFGATQQGQKYIQERILPFFNKEEIKQARQIAETLRAELQCHCKICQPKPLK